MNHPKGEESTGVGEACSFTYHLSSSAQNCGGASPEKLRPGRTFKGSEPKRRVPALFTWGNQGSPTCPLLFGLGKADVGIALPAGRGPASARGSELALGGCGPSGAVGRARALARPR